MTSTLMRQRSMSRPGVSLPIATLLDLVSPSQAIFALREMEGWFPPQSRPYRTAIGDPGSPVRRLYERRDWREHSG